MEMSPGLLLVTNADVSVFSVIATHFATLNRGVHALLSCPSSVAPLRLIRSVVQPGGLTWACTMK